MTQPSKPGPVSKFAQPQQVRRAVQLLSHGFETIVHGAPICSSCVILDGLTLRRGAAANNVAPGIQQYPARHQRVGRAPMPARYRTILSGALVDPACGEKMQTQAGPRPGRSHAAIRGGEEMRNVTIDTVTEVVTDSLPVDT